MGTPTVDAADRQLKQRHRELWASGDQPRMAAELTASLGPALVSACEVQPGSRVLDVAAGTGSAALAAAAVGATSVASDLTPELLTAGRLEAVRAGLELEWRQADAEALPFDDESFDVVLSVNGVMFAPHQERAAAELIRVCRPGGTIGLVAWTPQGFVGRLSGALRPYLPAELSMAPAPTVWGDETRVRDLLGDAVSDLVAHRRALHTELFPTPESLRGYFAAHDGHTIAAYAEVGDGTERQRALDNVIEDAAWHFGAGSGLGMDWEYLQVVARRVG